MPKPDTQPAWRRALAPLVALGLAVAATTGWAAEAQKPAQSQRTPAKPPQKQQGAASQRKPAAAAAAPATPAPPAEAPRAAGPLQVATRTIGDQCRIGGEGGPGLYRNVGARHECKLYAAPLGTIIYVVDESGEGVEITLANRGAKLNAPDAKVSTCGRGSMLILAVIALSAEEDGFERAVYNGVCVPGPFGAEGR